ncbi:2998_t:CDS:2 [Diversispora eburnea]|uniref:2998_t:CDS:1 n=1 Tax=Diversispora eburnea TaxID=1213867 RepID=A0A9N8VFG6_9GLOM|nr:2998_t:CDS:2 [Diversispora eburnea]
MSFRAYFYITLYVIVVLILLISFKFTKNEFPKQERSRFTGYLTWHGKLHHFDQESYDTSLWFLIITNGLSSIYAFIWASKKDLPKKVITYIYQENGSRTTAYFFNILIAYYITFTFISGVALYLLDTGKLFSAFAVLHNAFELAMMLLLLQGGKITSNYFYAIMGCYIFIVNLLDIALPWPIDGTWFKAQGLCLDFGFYIVLTRIYKSTREYVEGLASAQLPLVNEDEHLPFEDDSSISPTIIQHPQQFLLLIFSSAVHIFGNCFSTIFMTDSRRYI